MPTWHLMTPLTQESLTTVRQTSSRLCAMRQQALSLCKILRQECRRTCGASARCAACCAAQPRRNAVQEPRACACSSRPSATAVSPAATHMRHMGLRIRCPHARHAHLARMVPCRCMYMHAPTSAPCSCSQLSLAHPALALRLGMGQQMAWEHDLMATAPAVCPVL